MENLLAEIRNCTVCAASLPNRPRPILQASRRSKIVIIGQAPGQKVQDSGIPWDDQSGKELRRWLGVSKDQFYDPELFALIPMGFCYPGKGISGDLPPRHECAPLWHKTLFDFMKEVKLTVLIGQYAQNSYLEGTKHLTLTTIVKGYNNYLPTYLPLVHPSPRNKIWQKKNHWFEIEVVPALRGIVNKLL